MRQRAPTAPSTLIPMTDAHAAAHAAANAEQLRLLRAALEEGVGAVADEPVAPLVGKEAGRKNAAPTTPTAGEALRVPEHP